MNTSQIKEIIVSNAEEISRLHSAVHRTHDHRNDSKEAQQEWTRAAAEIRSRYEGLAFPGGYEGALQRIIEGDGFAMEAALCFLELRPFFFRSGYMFKDILRKCRKAPLSTSQSNRLQEVEAAIDEWRHGKTVPDQTLETMRPRQMDRGN
jgi:hypothetical protein